jgi:hypothetical protein
MPGGENRLPLQPDLAAEAELPANRPADCRDASAQEEFELWHLPEVAAPRLDALDVRTGKQRQVAEYGQNPTFETPSTWSQFGSLDPGGKSFATTVGDRKSDLWILEGVPQPRRRWF